VETKDRGRRTGTARRFVVSFVVAFAASLALVAACSTDAVQRRDGAAGPSAPACASDADCRLVSDYCDGCACRALAAGQADPTCKGTLVQCFVDPCRGQRAVCDAGACVTAR
jgi:hypothetical protein